MFVLLLWHVLLWLLPLLPLLRLLLPLLLLLLLLPLLRLLLRFLRRPSSPLLRRSRLRRARIPLLRPTDSSLPLPLHVVLRRPAILLLAVLTDVPPTILERATSAAGLEVVRGSQNGLPRVTVLLHP